MIFMVCHHWFCPKWWLCNGYSAASQVFADCYEKGSGLKQDQRICIKKQLAKQNILADFEKRRKVVTFLADEGQVLLSFEKLL